MRNATVTSTSAGRKRDFAWRLATPERGGEAGFRRLGLGALLGLCNWRVEGFFLGLHARYLLRTFWKSQIAISFPRLRPAAGAYEPPHPGFRRRFGAVVAALRLFLPDAGMVLSTRESPQFRDHLIPLGVTSMSAGSRTEPGGYAHESHAEAQFEVADERSPQVVAEVIRSKGYDPVWKDWDPAFLNGTPSRLGNASWKSPSTDRRKTIPARRYVTALLESLGNQPAAVVVERNRRIVPRCELLTEPIQDGDSLRSYDL